MSLEIPIDTYGLSVGTFFSFLFKIFSFQLSYILNLFCFILDNSVYLNVPHNITLFPLVSNDIDFEYFVTILSHFFSFIFQFLN